LLQISGVYMTCMVKYANGAVIGMATIQAAPKLTLEVQDTSHPVVREMTAFTEAVAGLRSAAGRRAATTPTTLLASTTLASALFLPSKQG